VGCDPGACSAMTLWADPQDLKEINFLKSKKSSLSIKKTWLYNEATNRTQRSHKLERKKQSCTVSDLENVLSFKDHKTLKYQNFMEACGLRNMCYNILSKFYFDYQRKNRWKTYNESREADNLVLKRFAEKFAPDGTVKTLHMVNLHFGDWSRSNKVKYGHAPVKGVGYRKLFRRAGVKVGLVNEYNTSKTLFMDQNKSLEKFKVNELKEQSKRVQLKHGILRAKLDNVAAGCTQQNFIQVCRDINAARNILFKGKCILGLCTRPQISNLFPKSVARDLRVSFSGDELVSPNGAIPASRH
jgi:hypothetical protein